MSLTRKNFLKIFDDKESDLFYRKLQKKFEQEDESKTDQEEKINDEIKPNQAGSSLYLSLYNVLTDYKCNWFTNDFVVSYHQEKTISPLNKRQPEIIDDQTIKKLKSSNKKIDCDDMKTSLNKVNEDKKYVNYILIIFSLI